jgi:hypothetical protein
MAAPKRLHFHELIGLSTYLALRELMCHEQVNPLVGEPWCGVDHRERIPSPGGAPGLFEQFALRPYYRVLTCLQSTRRDLVNEGIGGIPILLDQE